MAVPSISKFASNFCLSFGVKPLFPVEDERCMELELRSELGDEEK